MEYEEEAPGWRLRASTALDKLENVYLRILRIAILLAATAFILYAIYLALSGAYKITRSPDSVLTEIATVTPEEIVNAQASLPESEEVDGEPMATPEQQAFYTNFVKRYFTLFRTKFEPYRQPEDKKLSADEFDDAFVQSSRRMAAVATGAVSFVEDSQDLESLFSAMTAVADMARTKERLLQYKSAKKVSVTRSVRRTRTEYRRGWNSYSTNCSGWYYSPIGCPERRAVRAPYTTKVTTQEFPEGTQSHSKIFHAMQDEYFTLLEARRLTNAAKADAARSDIVQGNIEGHSSLAEALRNFAIFLGLMLVFLFIAMERHQRSLAALAASPRDE